MKLTVVFPTYNEESLIGRTIESSIQELSALGFDGEYEILVIDNGSQDRTPAIVKNLSVTHRQIRLVSHPRNLGYARSNLTAFREAKGEIIAVVDGDGQLTLRDLPLFFSRLDHGDHVVYGWRKHRHDPLFRIMVSFFLNQLSRVLLDWPYHDINCGYRVVARKVAEDVLAIREGNFFGPELWVRAWRKGWRVGEVEVEHFPRLGGQSIHGIWRMPASIWAGVSYLWSLRKELRSKDSLGGA